MGGRNPHRCDVSRKQSLGFIVPAGDGLQHRAGEVGYLVVSHQYIFFVTLLLLLLLLLPIPLPSGRGTHSRAPPSTIELLQRVTPGSELLQTGLGRVAGQGADAGGRPEGAPLAEQGALAVGVLDGAWSHRQVAFVALLCECRCGCACWWQRGCETGWKW